MDDKDRLIQIDTTLKMYMDMTNSNIDDIKKTLAETKAYVERLIKTLEDTYVTRKELPTLLEQHICERDKNRLNSANGWITFIKNAKDIIITVGVIALAIMQWGS